MSEDADFSAFLREIDAHFVHVLGTLLRWEVLEQPQVRIGNGNVVLRLRTAQGLFIFRVPRWSGLQLRRLALAYRHFGDSGLLPERIYHDAKCQLERCIEGVALSARVDDAGLAALGRALGRLHALPATGFGVLSHGCSGEYADAAAWLAATPLRPPLPPGEERDVLDAQQAAQWAALRQAAETPPPALARAACHVCHGDLWRSNILVDAGGQPWLIDWDQIGAYPRERDFVFMVDADLSAAQRRQLLAHYPFPLDPQLLRWFALRQLANRRRSDRRELLALAQRHELLEGVEA